MDLDRSGALNSSGLRDTQAVVTREHLRLQIVRWLVHSKYTYHLARRLVLSFFKYLKYLFICLSFSSLLDIFTFILKFYCYKENLLEHVDFTANRARLWAFRFTTNA